MERERTEREHREARGYKERQGQGRHKKGKDARKRNKERGTRKGTRKGVQGRKGKERGARKKREGKGCKERKGAQGKGGKERNGKETSGIGTTGVQDGEFWGGSEQKERVSSGMCRMEGEGRESVQKEEGVGLACQTGQSPPEMLL